MFCRNCGNELDDNATFCNRCGNPQGIDKTVVVKEIKDEPSHMAGLVGCCFPVVGLILFFLWKDEKPNSAKLVCRWTLGGFIAGILVYVIYFGLILSIGFLG